MKSDTCHESSDFLQACLGWPGFCSRMGPVEALRVAADKGNPMTSRPTKPLPPMPPPERKSPPMRAPRERSSPAWEPIPLHIPQPQAPERPARNSSSEEKSPRGVVIINYGDDE